MALSREFEDHVRDLFVELGPVRVQRMFGAAGVFAAEVLFAIATENGIYLKVDEASQAAFAEAGSGPFSYQAKNGRRISLPFWRLPETAADEPAEAARWGRLGIDAALRSRAARTAAKRGRRRGAGA